MVTVCGINMKDLTTEQEDFLLKQGREDNLCICCEMKNRLFEDELCEDCK